jgi:hypothetical protein
VVLAGAAGTASAGFACDRLARRDVRWRLLVPAVTAVMTTATLGMAFVAVPPGLPQMLLILLGGATATTRSARRSRLPSTSSRWGCARPQCRSSLWFRT